MTLPGWDKSAEIESEREAPAEESELVAINPNSTRDNKQQTARVEVIKLTTPLARTIGWGVSLSLSPEKQNHLCQVDRKTNKTPT